MLKQLELVGFKSFAERTVFEFGPGITAVVGPNGSGKSNVVDAIRWIMGEQSAKSLRGGGMTDVIFNGSATRKSLGMAEVSLTLDNSKRYLNVDADEVQITRRVYRDGTGEYLINKQMTRLKDIKELFLGSGAGTDAYSIIAQGRVDALLQASSQERRFILEEAAGISRFRAKKLETLRKLEQVEQNLLRVKDIHDELLRQLQTVRLPAAKAEKYRDYTQELKRLRVELALQDWHLDTQHWQRASQELDASRNELEQFQTQTSEQERQQVQKEVELAQMEETVHGLEDRLAHCREQQTGLEASLQHESTHQENLRRSQTQVQERIDILEKQLLKLQEQLLELTQKYAQDKKALEDQKAKVEEIQTEQNTRKQQLGELRKKLQTGKDTLYERLQQAARSHNEAISLKTQMESLQLQRKRQQDRHSQTQGTLTALDINLQTLEATESDLASRMRHLIETIEQSSREIEELNLQLESLTAQQTSMREKRSGLESRVQVLEHLEKSREGIGSDTRKVLERAATESGYPWNQVLGMLADLLLVDQEHAALVDAILGDRAQSLVVRDTAAVSAIVEALGSDLNSRLAFLALSSLKEEFSRIQVPGLPWLADYAGSSHSECPKLGQHVLAQCWVVESIEQALQWAQHYPGQIWGTRDGVVFDGLSILSMGPESEQHGFLSRRSELRDHREQIALCQTALEECDQEIDSLRAQINRKQVKQEQAEQAWQVLSEEAAGLRSQLEQKRLQGKELAEEVRLEQDEIQNIDRELVQLTYSEAVAKEKAALADAAARQLQEELQAAEQEAHALEQQKQRDHEQLMQLSVELAKLEEVISSLKDRQGTLEEDQQAKQLEVETLLLQKTQLAQELLASEQAFLTTEKTLEEGKRERATLETELKASTEQARGVREALQQLREKNSQVRQTWQGLIDRVHTHERVTGELRLKLDALATRLQEEYGVDLAEMYQNYVPPETLMDATVTQQEMAELKRKIHRLGNVSMDSLEELQILEKRSSELEKQLEDLQQAKSTLDEIIHKINADSKKLFQQTYDSVRVHFQELFRKVFGGGMADIILENPDDLLETGVDIVARPPGKEMRNMSLLSGGEKTLTAVALLLAIFKNKPSPFCIMDEVDAALDEANVGRFAAVLREFLHLSQFILITHSKKTMTAADVLYGVTMQEAGISKRVAMRLEEYEEPTPRLAA